MLRVALVGMYVVWGVCFMWYTLAIGTVWSVCVVCSVVYCMSYVVCRVVCVISDVQGYGPFLTRHMREITHVCVAPCEKNEWNRSTPRAARATHCGICTDEYTACTAQFIMHIA